MSITVFLSEGRPVFMKGIAEQLRREKNLTITMVEENGISTLDYILQQCPDILIYDIDANGEKIDFPMLREIRKAHSDRVQIIAISDCERIGTFLNFFRYGGNGYLFRFDSEEKITLAVRNVSLGRPFLSNHFLEFLLQRILTVAPPEDAASFYCLSNRHREVLTLWRGGCSDEKIAERLDISIKTVDNHRKAAMQILGIHTVTNLMIKILFSDIEEISDKSDLSGLKKTVVRSAKNMKLV